MAKSTIWNSGTEFERDVTRIARALWPNAWIDGAMVVDGRERDGIFVTEEAVHILECTTSRSKAKAIEDITKSVKLSRQLRQEYSDKIVQCWFITADEPTAEQRAVATKIGEVKVTAQSYDSFRGRLIKAGSYMDMRREYAFGSARNLRDGSSKIGRNEYIGLDLLRMSDSQVFSAEKVANELLFGSNNRAVLLGDYGAGKSMTLREIYLSSAEAYREGRTSRFPVYINLRDHSGQQEPIEVLERHARRIGFDPPHHLVRAWRAGFLALILDGFDELSTTGWMAFNRKLKDSRYATVEAVRRFVRETPSESGIIVAGRVSYFDDVAECINALGFKKDATSVLSLNDFSEPQIKQYLDKLGVTSGLPAWLPSRPLLIGALAVRGVLGSGSGIDTTVEPGVGWDSLLRIVCERESATHEAVDADAIRGVIEQLSSIARVKGGLNAPLSLVEIANAYVHVQGVEPDERAQTLLLRLPGLGNVVGGEEARAFVDIDFASAASAGDVARFIENPFGSGEEPVVNVKEVLQEVGVAVAIEQLTAKNIPHEKLYVAIGAAVKLGSEGMPQHALASDIVKIIASAEVADPKTIPRVGIQEVIIDELDLTSVNAGLSGVAFTGCIFSTLYLPDARSRDEVLPRFIQCEFGHIEGRGGADEVDASHFKDCTFGTFSGSLATNAAVIDSRDLEPGLKALVTVLRKLFLQKGAGRKQNAFYRGIGGGSGVTTKVVDKILDALSSADFASPSKRGAADQVWLPNRRLAARAKAIVANPKESREPLVAIARAIEN